jgi:predicted ribosome-associated RNA-binding protein Tma20
MFKNDQKISQSYVMSKKEKKDLGKKLIVSYNKEAIDYLVNKFEELTIHKISNTKKKIITYQNDPILFEFDNDLFFPTVYLLNYFPDMITRKALIYRETDSYLDNGADLMLKGVRNREHIKKNVSFRLNDLFSVQTETGYNINIKLILFLE